MTGICNEIIFQYLYERRQHLVTIKQDLLPLMVYMGFSGRPYQDAIYVAAGWVLYLAAAHLLDDAQDNANMPNANAAVAAIGAANFILVDAPISKNILLDILDALGRVTFTAANAQASEKKEGHLASRTEYFELIIQKAAVIIATGVWMGGRLATDNLEKLDLLKEFGLAWGMAAQIADDCTDLVDDLSKGLYTLPVIEGLLKISHPNHLQLKQLVSRRSLDDNQIQTVCNILESMGAIIECKRLVRAYQLQAMTIFSNFPGLKPLFSTYFETVL